MTRKNTSEDIWKRIKVGNVQDCWPWLGHVDDKGYGRMKLDGKEAFVHRISYELTWGSIPNNRIIMHMCNNPLCCNPGHLKLGTYQDNRKHWAATKTGLTEEKIQLIKNMYKSGQHTQTDLATTFGVDQTTISNIVLGKLSL